MYPSGPCSISRKCTLKSCSIVPPCLTKVEGMARERTSDEWNDGGPSWLELGSLFDLTRICRSFLNPDVRTEVALHFQDEATDLARRLARAVADQLLHVRVHT